MVRTTATIPPMTTRLPMTAITAIRAVENGPFDLGSSRQSEKLYTPYGPSVRSYVVWRFVAIKGRVAEGECTSATKVSIRQADVEMDDAARAAETDDSLVVGVESDA
jgi:hypothetical protein